MLLHPYLDRGGLATYSPAKPDTTDVALFPRTRVTPAPGRAAEAPCMHAAESA